MKRLMDSLFYGVLAPMGFWLAMFRYYKTQCLEENRIVTYNRSLRA